MFAKMSGVASELAGTADITAVIRPGDFQKQQCWGFLMIEDGEMPAFILKSKQDEYAWTQHSFVHLDGTSATSSKRLVNRYAYKEYAFKEVRIETAGTIDLDCEIKFTLVPFDKESGHYVPFSIDVRKAELPLLTCLYKALFNIGAMQTRAFRQLSFAKESLKHGCESLHRGVANAPMNGPAPGIGQSLREASGTAMGWLDEAEQRFIAANSNFAPVFDRYVKW